MTAARALRGGKVLSLETGAFEKEVAAFVKKLPAKVGQGVRKLALDLTRFTTRRTPMDTGRAAAGWLPFAHAMHGASYGVRGPGVARGLREGSYRADVHGKSLKPFVELTNAVPYIVPLETGARPHVIEARRARALRFVRGGRVIFRRRVNHPGMRGYHALTRSMRDIRRFVERRMEEVTR